MIKPLPYGGKVIIECIRCRAQVLVPASKYNQAIKDTGYPTRYCGPCSKKSGSTLKAWRRGRPDKKAEANREFLRNPVKPIKKI